jgi:aryl-alcohol dehydrogenase (NADP+)
LAWLLVRPQTVVPILGARRLEHLEANLAALDVHLTTDHLRVLDEVSAPGLNYPAEMNGQTRAMLQFGGTTVDGETSTVYPPLRASDIRY